MDGSTKPKKPNPKSVPSPAKPGAKRPAEQNGKESRNKKSKISNGDEEDGAIEEKKSAINRLWSEDDEIAILKGMIDYKSKKGADPYADMGAFHEFLKKSLHVDVTKNQLTDKIRRLKKKYQNNAEKGDEPVFSKPHEHKSFELSKKIWGVGGASNGADDNVKSTNKKSTKNSSSKVNTCATSPKLKEVAQEHELQETSKGDVNASQEEFCSMYPRLKESLQSESEKVSPLSLTESGKNLVMEGLSLIGSAKAKELEEKWNNFRIDEVELYLKRVDLIQEQTKSVLAAMKSSKS
uniref:Putative mediator-associated protein 1-like n=1 Tax=Davidia involucrata TaxID=16924 RepID=A0A5B6YZZ7_DAVIN